MPITGSKPITADRSPGIGRCAVSHSSAAHAITAGHAFVQNLRQGHYELRIEEPPTLQVVAAFTELTVAI
jgi:hypothetical protein